MMQYEEPHFFEFENPWNGKTMTGYFTIHKYWYNGRTALKIRAKEKLSEDFFFLTHEQAHRFLPLFKGE